MTTTTKHKILAPKLRFKGFNTFWTNKPAADLFTNSRKKGDNSLPIYSVTLNQGMVPRNSLDRTMGNDAKSEDNLYVAKNDIAYNMMRMWQGAYGIAPEKCMVSPAYVVLHPKENICPKFFVGYFNRSRSLFLFTAFSYGLTSDRLRLYYKDFARIKFAIPDNEEQQKIASFLSAVDEKIQLLTRKKELLEQYKKGVMQQLFSGKLRFKDENGKAFPKWEEKKLQEIASINTGSSNRQDSGLDGEFTFFDRSQDIRTSSIFLFDGEAIIVAGEGQEFAPKHFNGKFDLHQRTYAIMNYKNAIGKYLFYYIHYHRNYFFIQAVGTTVKSLRLPMFQKMNIQVPVIDEQKKIADYLSNIDNKIDSVTKQITQNQTFKKGLLQQMFV